MKSKVLLCCIVLMFATALAAAQTQTCNTIKSGTIFDTTGQVIQLGFDKWGYNYQAHLFNGLYDNYSRPPVPVTTGRDNLIMKWSDDWLSNKDCAWCSQICTRPDGYLDRGGDGSGISKGWLTNQMEGDYDDVDGNSCHYTYYAKIVYVGPAPTTGTDPWAAGRIWGVYSIIEEVSNDPCAGQHGLNRSNVVRPAGFGFYTN
jgi:hypothetical protein